MEIHLKNYSLLRKLVYIADIEHVLRHIKEKKCIEVNEEKKFKKTVLAWCYSQVKSSNI